MKSVGRLFFVFYATVLLSPALWAQISPAGMSFVDTNNPEFDSQWIEISDGNEIAATGGDDEFHSVNFGFSFRFYSQTYSTVYVSTNGYLTFNNYGAVDPYTINDNLTSGVPPDRMLAVYWDDLILDENSARIYYKVIGSFPYRKLIVEYKDVKIKGGISLITFQVILHETTNLIQYHYLDLAGEQGAAATVGLKFDPDRLVYSFNNPSLSDNLGILFIPSSTLSAVSSISPTQAAVGTNGQQFRLAINNLTTGATQLAHMGKADVVRVFNPLPNPISTVESIRVRGIDYFFIQRTTPPTPAEYNTLPTIATWYYDDGIDSLFIQLPPYVARDSVSVAFRVNLPGIPGGYNFNARTYPRSNFANGAATSSAITLVAGTVHHYTIDPQTWTITAGNNLQFTVRAYDEFDNLVANNGSANNSVIGSTTALVTPTTSNFNNNNFYNFIVSDTTAGTYSARAVNTTPNSPLRAQTGIITVNPRPATVLVKISGDSTGVIAGANQILQTKVTDEYSNPISGWPVLYTVLQGGGNFGGGMTSKTVSTDSDGIAQITYSTGPLVMLNRVNANLVGGPGVNIQFDINTVPGSLSYYTVTPANFNPTVGNNVSVTVAAFDANNNPVTTNSTTVVEFLSDGNGVTLTPPSATLVSGATSFMVSNTIAETFRVQARSQAQPSITGFSNPITTTAGAPDILTKISGDNQTGPISMTLPLDLQVEVNDQYGNPVGGTTVTFDPIGGGTALTPNAVTNSAGIASSGWTVHSTATPDTMAAYIAGVDTVIFTATVVPGSGVTMTQLPPFTSSGVVDNFVPDNFRVRITDGGNNPVPNFPVSFAIVAKPAGAANDSLTVYSATTNAQGEVGTLLHLGTKVGTYRVRAYSSTTTPNFVDFTATATHGAADRILIASGNNQSGTVDQPLTNPVAFQLVDPYDNPVADSTLNFNPLNGSANPVSALTNVSGQASTSWTLGQTVGAQKMVATLNTLTSDTAYATAGPAGGASLALVSMNQITSDSIAALRGEDVTVIVEARDAFGNLAPNTTVNFEALPGFNVIFQDLQVTTDAQGRAINIVTTDTGNDSTFFRAYINGLDTLDLHIFHIRYAGGLTPQAVSPGDIPSFSLDLENLSSNSVSLNQGATQLRFSDGAYLFSATLSGPLTLPPGITTVSFDPALVDTNFVSGNYAPEVLLRGSGTNALLGGSVKLPANSLTIFAVSITRITGSKSAVTGGDTVTIIMRVRKAGPVTVNVNNVGLDIAGSPPIPQSNIIPSPANPTVLPSSPGISTHLFEFVVNVPGNASGDYIVNGQFQGTTLSGFPANDFSADTTFAFAVSVSANLSLDSLDPDTVTTGQAVNYTASLYNDGIFDILLNPNLTYLAFGSDTVYLKQSYSVPSGGIANLVDVEFVTPAILSPAQLAAYPLNLRLYGTENGIAFDTTIVNATTMQVQNPPTVTVALIDALADTVAQNQDSVRTIVQLTNGNPLSAPAVILLPSGVKLSTNVLNNRLPTGSGNIILAGGATSSPIEFVYPISSTYPPGTDRVKVSYDYSDFNSGTPYSAAPADSDTFVVLSRAQLSLLQGHILEPDTVYAGQDSVQFRFTVRNNGQSPATIDGNDISIQFNNNHTINLVSTTPGTLPAVLAENDSLEFTYNIAIDPASAIGPDPLNLTVSYSDTFSGKPYNVAAMNLDTLRIVSGIGPADVQIQTVQFSRTTANQGQSGVLATVRLKNSSQVTVQIESLNLGYSRPGISDSLLTALGSIPGGATADFQFTLSVNDTMAAGAVTVDAGYQATVPLFGTTFSDSGAVSPGVLTIYKPANFTFTPDSVTLVPDTAIPGQSGIIATTVISNGDSLTSPSRVNALQALFSVGGMVSGTLINPPALPTILPGGEELQVQFRLTVADTAIPGSVDVRIVSDARDLTDNTTFSDTTLAAALTIQQKAQLGLQSLTPDSVTTGEAFTFTAALFNEGDDDVLLKPTLSYLKFDSDSIQLKQSYSVPAGDTVEVAFVSHTILNSARAAPYLADLHLAGTQSGINFNITLFAADSVLVQDPPSITVALIDVLPDTVAQNQDSISAQVQLANSGALNAPARITLPAGVTLSTLDIDSIAATGSNSFTLNAGQTSGPINFLFNLKPTNPIGIDTAKVRYRFTDLNSLKTHSAASDSFDTFVVLSRARLSLQSHSLVPDTVSPGQTGVQFSFTVRNDGESPAAIDSGDVIITFTNNHSITRTFPLPVSQPVLVSSGSTQQFDYNIDVSSNSNIGLDPLDLTVRHTDTLSGKMYQDIAVDNLDTLRIIQGTTPAEVQIQTVKLNPTVANQGQSGVQAKVRLKNLAQHPVRIDALSLFYSRPGISDSLLTPLPAQGEIAPGDTVSFAFTLSVADTMPVGAVAIDAAYDATDLLFLTTFSDSGAVAPGALSVLRPANFTFTPLTLVPDTASQGQTGIIASTVMSNGDANTSPARVDSFQAIFSVGGDTVTAQLINPLTVPLVLPGGESVQVQYRLTVSSTASPGTVDVRIAANARDLTDSRIFADTSQAALLTVQQRASLQIVALEIPPDSAYLGQSQIPVKITVQNTGGGLAQLNAVSLALHNAPNFPKSLLTFDLPVVLSLGQQKEVNYQISVPSNINLPNADSLIYAGATLQGVEVSSGTALIAAADSLDSLLISEPPFIEFIGIPDSISTVYDIGDTAQFVLEVVNTGGTPLTLNPNTFVRLENTTAPSQFFTRPIDLLATNPNILPGDTTQLVFRDTVVTDAGDYRFSLGVRGNVYQAPNQIAYLQDILTNAFLNVGGNISIQLVQVIPDVVQAGDTSIFVNAIVENNTIPVAIDPGATLDFSYNDGEPLAIIPTRIDTLTMVGTTAMRDTLKWKFDVPFSAHTGEANVEVTLTFSNGAITPAPRTGFFDIQSGAKVKYVANSLTPSTVVSGQTVAFNAKFINSGSENFLVNAANSFLEFSDGQDTLKTSVNGNFVVRGTAFGQQQPDTSEIAFHLDTLDSLFVPGNYDITFHLFGELPNHDTLTAVDTVYSSQVAVIPEALVSVDSIDVIPTAIISGQGGVEVRYLIRNSGASAATVHTANSLFTDSLGADISTLWSLQNQSLSFPFTLNASDSTVLTRNFVVSQNIIPGPVWARLIVNYNDIRKPNVPRMSDDPAVYDSVNVIVPSRIFVNTLELEGVPNAVNQTVNFNQTYNLRLTLQNSGQDSVRNITVRFFDDADGSIILTDTISDTILPPGAPYQRVYPFTAGSISDTIRYRAVILEAISVTSGTPVSIGEPLDNRENVFIQMPTQLELLVEASGDSAYSQGQDFTVSFSIIPTGQSPFGTGNLEIELPPDFNLVSPSAQLPVGPSNLSGSWQVTASPDTTIGAFDLIQVSYLNIPLDLNTDSTVALANDSVIVPVQVVEGGSVKVTSITIPEPPGAMDSTLSSGQQFRLSAVVVYSGSVDTTGRTARVKLPPGFIIDPDSVVKTIQTATATVSWGITISETILQTFANALSGGSNGEDLGTVSRRDRNNPERGGGKTLSTGDLERLLNQDFQLQVTASGVDGGDPNATFSNTRGKQVTVVERVSLVMHSEVVAPAGATLGTVSTYQPFDVKIWVTNEGVAGVIPADSNRVTVKVPQGFTIEGLAAGDSLTNYPLKTGLAEADTIRIFAPPTVPTTQPLVRVRLDSAARDENTNLAANIQQALSSFNLAVESRVSLRIDNLTAGGDSLLQNQDFTLQGLVTNTGDANVEPNRVVTVKLSFDTTAFSLINPQDTVKTVQLVNKQGVISWQMRTKPDATTGNNHFITASIDSTLSWDENDFPARGVHLEKGTATDTLSILGSGAFSIAQAYLNTPGTDSLTVSTFQAVQVVVIPQIAGLFVNRTATLYLPDIFPTDSMVASIPAGGNPVVFNIQIPDTASGLWEQLQVRIRAASQINPNFIVSDSAYLYIFVEKRASLAMNSAVIAPAGATLGTVSTYQPFDVKIWVENLGQASVLPTDSNRLTVKVPQGFTIEGLAAGDSLTNYPLKTGLAEADTIRIFAPPTVPTTQPLVRVRLDSAARDENTNLPANIQQALSSFNLAVESRVSLRIDNLTAGADSLVQDQQFTLQGLVTNTGDANVEPNRIVTVKLSFDTTAFNLINPQDTMKTVQLVNKQGVISWQMHTKPDANLATNPYYITASIDSTLSWDENDFPARGVHLEKGTATDTLSILDTGVFSITQAYLNTPGTDSLTVSTTQAVQVVVIPQIAGLFENRIATLYFPDIFPTDSMVTSIPAGGNPVTFNIQIPDTVSGLWEQLRVKIRGTSQINNTIILSDSADLYVFLQKRATLALSGQIVSGGFNNTVSQGQTFVYQSQVANTGQAGVQSTPQGQLTIELGDKLDVDPDSTVKNFDIGTPVRWTIDVSENAQASALLRQIQSVQNDKARLIVAAQRSAAPEGRQGNTRMVAAGQQSDIPEGRQLTAQANRAANSPANAGNFGQSREIESLDDQLSGLYKELSSIVDTSYLKVTISRRPLDVNSGQLAAVEIGTDSVTISVAEKPTIDILTSTVAPTWSTEQNGIVEVTVDAPENVIERSGTLRLPEGFSFINPADSLKTFGQGSTVSWGIRANAVIPQPTLPVNLTVIVKGRDQNNPPPNTVVVTDTTLLPITIERKALLALNSQSTSIRLLRGETFTVEATVNNQGAADISGNGRVRLNIGSEGFGFASGETAEKEFTVNNATGNATIRWDVVAPDFDANTVFGIGFTQLPNDVNTQNTVSVSIDTLVFDVNMVSRRITVKQLDNIELENSYVQGDVEVPVVGVGFTNPNSVEDIFLKGFTISILEGDGEIPVSDMQNLLSRVEVVSYDYYQGSLAKINSPPDRLGELIIDSQTSNPFTLNFANVDTIRGATTDSLVLWIDLANQPVNRNFRVQLRAADAEGAFVGKVDVVDSLGTPLEALNLWSPSITILSTDPEEAFRNYPNPFSMETQLPGAPKGSTRFSFIMNNSGDVDLRIYTLMGQLVWSTQVANLPGGLHNSVLSWDGRNGQGNRVVNGVYVAVLKVNYSNGGSETFQTKVAYIK